MGTAAGWLRLREGNAINNRHISQLIDTLTGEDPGRPITVKRSDAALILWGASDSGVIVSPDGVLPASNFFIYPNMAVYWNGLAADVPPNFSILAAAQNRFIWNANADGDVGATGGSNDHTHTGPSHTHTGPSHTHTGPSHTHTSASHTHDLSAHTHSSASHSHDLSDHTHDGGSHSHDLSEHTHEVSISHDHANSTTGDDNTSESVQEGTSGSFKTVSDHVHQHPFDVVSISADTTSDGPDPDSTSSDSITTNGPDTDSTSSDQPADTGGPDPDLTSSDAPGPTGASGTAATGASGTDPTGASGTGTTSSSSQQPPVAYWRGYLIERQ